MQAMHKLKSFVQSRLALHRLVVVLLALSFAFCVIGATLQGAAAGVSGSALKILDEMKPEPSSSLVRLSF